MAEEKLQSSKKELTKIISQVRESVEKLELPESLKSEVFGALLTVELLKEEAPGKKGSKIRIKETQREELTLPERILALRNNNFFRSPRTDADVHTEITKTYPCDLNRVSVALLRLSKKKELRRTTKVEENKEYIAYAW
jgi:hypothetical protein